VKFQANACCSKITVILLGLAVIAAFLWALFFNNPYPVIRVDPDSVYIFSSLSKLTDKAIRHNDHPGLILQITGTVPILLGSILCREEGLIQKVIANMPFFHQLFVGLIGLTHVVALIFFFCIAFQKNKPIQTAIIALIGIATLTPPSLSGAMTVNADMYAYSLSIFYVVSLLWKRSWKNDLITSLFFVLIVYTKIIFLPLGLLMLAKDKKCLLRLLTGTLLWAGFIFLVFWDIDQFIRFKDFMLNSSMLNKPVSLTLDSILGFHKKFFLKNTVQSVYILLFLFFSILLAIRKKHRAVGILVLLTIISVFEISLLRQGKAVIYTWPVFSAGMLLMITFYKSSRRLISLTTPIFVILLILSITTNYKTISDYRKLMVQRRTNQQEYEKIITQLSPTYLLEYHGKPAYHFHAIGSSYWMGNSYSGREYASYLKDYFHNRFGLEDLLYVSGRQDGSILVKQYFGKEKIDYLQWSSSENCYLSIGSGKLEQEFLKAFPQIELIPVYTLQKSNLKISKIQQKEPALPGSFDSLSPLNGASTIPGG